MRTTSLAACVDWPLLEALEPRLLLDGTPEEQALELFSASPALFVENQGQWADPSVRYVHHGSGASVAMTDSGPVFQVFRQVPREGADAGPEDDLAGPLGDRFDPDRYRTEVLQFSASFLGANAVTPVGLAMSEAYFNYFVGDQADWRSEVPAYEQVAYQGLYDGIDLVTWGQRDSLKYEFRVAPGADGSQIQVRYDGIRGLSLAEDGSLLVDLGEGWGSLTDDAPYIYQVIEGEQVEVGGRFVLVDEWTYSFEVTGLWDPSRGLVIDPDLAWSTYLGGSAYDHGLGIAVDAGGSVLVTGSTESSGWTSGGFDTTHDGVSDAFVAKLSPKGGHIWSTYLGGTNWDYAFGIAVDGAGSVLVTGAAGSSGWTSGGFDTTYNGGSCDAFVAKLSPTGGHLWSAYLGGSTYDSGSGIVVDAGGNVLVTGLTRSSGWTSGGFDTTHDGASDAFVAKIIETPRVTTVVLNADPARTVRTVSDIEPSGIGVRTIEVTFSETVFFDAAAVVLKAVEFSTGTEQEVPGGLPAVSVTGSGTNVMTITLGDPSGTVGAVDTWVKVTLAASGITDAAGNALDGEPENDSSGLGYIYDTEEDLPSGNGVAGGNAVFYVGSLRCDMQGPTSSDMTPDGRITPWDINGFTILYLEAVAAGRHLDPLPVAGPLAVGSPMPVAMPEVLADPEVDLLRRERAAQPFTEVAQASLGTDDLGLDALTATAIPTATPIVLLEAAADRADAGEPVAPADAADAAAPDEVPALGEDLVDLLTLPALAVLAV